MSRSNFLVSSNNGGTWRHASYGCCSWVKSYPLDAGIIMNFPKGEVRKSFLDWWVDRILELQPRSIKRLPLERVEGKLCYRYQLMSCGKNRDYRFFIFTLLRYPEAFPEIAEKTFELSEGLPFFQALQLAHDFINVKWQYTVTYGIAGVSIRDRDIKYNDVTNLYETKVFPKPIVSGMIDLVDFKDVKTQFLNTIGMNPVNNKFPIIPYKEPVMEWKES